MANITIDEQLNKRKKLFKTINIAKWSFIGMLIASTILFIAFSSILNQFQNDNINELQSIENGSFAERYPDLDPNQFLGPLNTYESLKQLFMILIIVSLVCSIAFIIVKRYYQREKLETIEYEVNDSFEA